MRSLVLKCVKYLKFFIGLIISKLELNFKVYGNVNVVIVLFFKSKNKFLYLFSSKNGYIFFILIKESNVVCGEIIFLFCFFCSKIKDIVSYLIFSF